MQKKGTFSAQKNAADLLARPHGALFQGLSSLQLALPAVQGPQVPQGGVHCRAGCREKHTDIYQRRQLEEQFDPCKLMCYARKCKKKKNLKD